MKKSWSASSLNSIAGLTSLGNVEFDDKMPESFHVYPTRKKLLFTALSPSNSSNGSLDSLATTDVRSIADSATNAGRKHGGVSKLYQRNIRELIQKVCDAKEHIFNDSGDDETLNGLRDVQQKLEKTLEEIVAVEKEEQGALLHNNLDQAADLALSVESLHASALRAIQIMVPAFFAEHVLSEGRSRLGAGHRRDGAASEFGDDDSLGGADSFSNTGRTAIKSYAKDPEFPMSTEALGISDRPEHFDAPSTLRHVGNDSVLNEILSQHERTSKSSQFRNRKLNQSLGTISRFFRNLHDEELKPLENNFICLNSAMDQIFATFNVEKVEERRSAELQDKFLNKENEILPALKTRLDAEAANQDNLTIEHTTLNDEAFLGRINVSDRAYAKGAIALFGLATTANVYSKDFRDRLSALRQLRKYFDGAHTNAEAKHALIIVTPMLCYYINDNLYNLFSAGLDFIDRLLKTFLTSHTFSALEMRHFVDGVLPVLIWRYSESDRRFPNKIHDFICGTVREGLTISNCFMKRICAPLDDRELPRARQNRAKLFYDIVVELFRRKSGLTEKCVADLAFQYLQSADSKIRSIGKQVVTFLYENGNRHEVQKRLQPLLFSSINNRILKILMLELEQIDHRNKRQKSDFIYPKS